jgi:hypothetical protein
MIGLIENPPVPARRSPKLCLHCGGNEVTDLLKEWREPSHEEFNGRNAWSLFNSYTEVLKGNLAELPRRTERLHGLLDSEIGWWAN